MSSRPLICLALILTAAVASAVDWELFAVQSDPSLDPALLEAMKTGDQETRIGICRGLARRQNPAAGVFLEALAADHAGSQDWRIEHCLRILLAGLFPAGADGAALRTRADANMASLDILFSHATEWRDPQLLGILMRAATVRTSPEGIQAVMITGRRIIGKLEAEKGLLLPQEAFLALDCLQTAESLARGDFLPLCTDIARLSRDKVVVDAARQAARTLAACP